MTPVTLLLVYLGGVHLTAFVLALCGLKAKDAELGAVVALLWPLALCLVPLRVAIAAGRWLRGTP